MLWVAECFREGLVTECLQSVSRFAALSDKLSENEEVSTGLLCFQASASASVYKDHDKEADTRIMRLSVLADNLGAPFDGTSFDGTPFYGLGTPFDGTPFERLGTPFEGATFEGSMYIYMYLFWAAYLHTLLQRSTFSLPLFQPQIGFYLHTYLSLRGGYTYIMYHGEHGYTPWEPPKPPHGVLPKSPPWCTTTSFYNGPT
ncbi:unnamed protein product [Camellia sinensis]